jgi:hypothetical protein
MELKMLSTAINRFPPPPSGVQSLVCFVLALLFLYNPFMATPGIPGVLKVAHPTSYRATVASSELQHFSAPEGPLDVVFVEAWLESFEPIGTEQSHAFVCLADDAPPPLQFMYANLWFRPPPAV